MAPVFNIAIFIYPGADMIDFTGPLEIYSTSPPPNAERAFKTTTFASESPVRVSANALSINTDASVADIEANLADYDILIVPGAWPQTIFDWVKTDEGKRVLKLLSRFAQLKPREETGHRIIQSVCTGALILASSGILAGKTATTHHIAYDDLKRCADEAAGGGSKIEVLRKRRWVDSGLNEAGVRIVNAGGVTSGFDASLKITEMLVGKEYSDWAAEVAEFEGRGENEGWSE